MPVQARTFNYLEQSLALCRMLGDRLSIAIVLINLGNVAYYQADYSSARIYLEQGLEATRVVQVREREANCLCKLGEVTMSQGDLLSAQAYFEQSLALSRTAPKALLLPETLGNLAITYMLLLQEDRAYAALCEALDTARNQSVTHLKLLTLIAAARVWILPGKALSSATWLGLVENDPHPAVNMTDLKRDLHVARAECEAALSPEQYAAAWEVGKTLDVDTVVNEILRELQAS
jgi:tetratricopeptide (TPR) repeat protein